MLDAGDSEPLPVSDIAIGLVPAEREAQSKTGTALDYIVDSDKVMVRTPDETATRQDRISPPPSAKPTSPWLLNTNL